MTDLMRGGMRRLIIFQPNTGNIVDLGEHSVESLDYGSSPQTQMMDDSTQWVQSNQRTLSVTITDQPALRMLRYMQEVDCPVNVTALGNNQHLPMYALARLVRSETFASVGDVGQETFKIVTGRKYADARVDSNLVGEVPWTGANSQVREPKRLGQVGISGTPQGIGSFGSADSDFVGIESGGGDVVELFTGTKKFDVTPAGTPKDITYDSVNDTAYISDENKTGDDSSIITVDSTGSFDNSFDYYDTKLKPSSVAYNEILDVLYVVEEDNDRVDVMAKGSLSTLQRSFATDSSNPPIAIAFNNTEGELFLTRDDGTTEVYDGNSAPESLLRSYNEPETERATFHAGTWYGFTLGDSIVTRYRWYALSPAHFWGGRQWTTPDTVTISPDVTGGESNLSTAKTAILRFPFPASNAEVDVAFAGGGSGSGSLVAQDWNGNKKGSISIGGPLAPLVLPFDVWSLKIELTSASTLPQLKVVSTGTPRGVLYGEITDDCQTRATTPRWTI